MMRLEGGVSGSEWEVWQEGTRLSFGSPFLVCNFGVNRQEIWC